jgi:LPPG:FO 2-phospho-L-lactate transferase
MIAVLSGGVGGARFLRGLCTVIDPREVVAIVNTADDIDLLGLHISPDLDIVTYTLASVVDEQRGWGFEGDSFYCLGALSRLGEETWFLLGDQDLATHIHRTRLLSSGVSLSQVTAQIAERLGVRACVIPMTDDHVQTWIDTGYERVHFQEYLVKRKGRDPVQGVEFRGIQLAHPAPGVLNAIESAEAIVIAPSNPIVSIGPILGISGIREAMVSRRAQAAAVSPIVAGAAVKGPAVEIMQGIGLEVSARGIASLYRDVIGLFVMDHRDEELHPEVEKLGLRTLVRETVMQSAEDWAQLAAATLEGVLGRR